MEVIWCSVRGVVKRKRWGKLEMNRGNETLKWKKKGQGPSSCFTGCYCYTCACAVNVYACAYMNAYVYVCAQTYLLFPSVMYLNGCTTHTHAFSVARVKDIEPWSASSAHLFSTHSYCSLSLFLSPSLQVPWFSLGNSFAAAGYSKSVSPSAAHSFYPPTTFNLYKLSVPHLFIYCCSSIHSLVSLKCSALPGHENRMMRNNGAKQGKKTMTWKQIWRVQRGPILLPVICKS